MPEEARKATFDFHAFAKAVLEIPEPTTQEIERARVAGELLQAIGGTGGPPLDARYLMGLPPQTFLDANRIISGEASDAPSRAEAQEADPDGWAKLLHIFGGLAPVTDPRVAPEFI